MQGDKRPSGRALSGSSQWHRNLGMGVALGSAGSLSPAQMEFALPKQKCNMVLQLPAPFTFTSLSCLLPWCMGRGGFWKINFRYLEWATISVLPWVPFSLDTPLGPTNMFILLAHTQYSGEMVFSPVIFSNITVFHCISKPCAKFQGLSQYQSLQKHLVKVETLHLLSDI